jgi:hypothetical protein
MPERPRARDRYEHHPLAEMFPLLKDAEFHELDDRFHETTQLDLGLSIHGMRPFRASHMIRTLETLA